MLSIISYWHLLAVVALHAKVMTMNAASRLRVQGRSPSLQLAVEPTLCSPVCYIPPAAPSMLSSLTSVKIVFIGIAPSSE